MKKFIVACLAVALPAALFAACTGGMASLTLSSNWYANTSSSISAATHEELTYLVRYEAEEDGYVAYADGSYKTKLTAETISLANGENELCYHLNAVLDIPVTFTVDGESETFTDRVVSDVWFRDVRHELRPVRSEKSVLTHTPASDQTPASLEEAYFAYDYTFTAEYDIDCTSAEVAIVYRTVEGEDEAQEDAEPVTETMTVALDGSGTYFDNEQLLFGLRAVDLSAGASFRSVNPVKRVQETVGVTTEPIPSSETLRFSLNGGEAEEREISAISFSIGYSGANSGLSQSLVYAVTTDASANTYRNVLLRMDVPVLHSLGTLRYSLTEATFSD